jgi:hypothetical protein
MPPALLVFRTAPLRLGLQAAAPRLPTFSFAWPRGVTAWRLLSKGNWMRDALQRLLIRALLALSRALVSAATRLTRKADR